jgi:hypothetical protein
MEKIQERALRFIYEDYIDGRRVMAKSHIAFGKVNYKEY